MEALANSIEAAKYRIKLLNRRAATGDRRAQARLERELDNLANLQESEVAFG